MGNILDDDKYKGYVISTKLDAKLGADGRWIVKQTLIQSRSENLEDWETKELEMNAVSENLRRAVNEATFSIGSYLEIVDGDLFNEVKPASGELLQ